MKKLKILIPTLAITLGGCITPLVTSCTHKLNVTIEGGTLSLGAYFGDSGRDIRQWIFKVDDQEKTVDSWNIKFEKDSPTSNLITANNGFVGWNYSSGTDILQAGIYEFKLYATYEGEEYYTKDVITLKIEKATENIVTGGSPSLKIQCDQAGQDEWCWSAKRADGSIVQNPTYSLEPYSPTSNGEITIRSDGRVSWPDDIQAGVYMFKIKAVADGYEGWSGVVTYTFVSTPSVLTVSGGSESINTYFGDSGKDGRQWVAKLDDELAQGATFELIPDGSLVQIPKNITIANGYVSWQHSVDGQTLAEGDYTFKVKASYKSKTAMSNTITLTVQKAQGLIVTGGTRLLNGNQISEGADEFAWKTTKDGKEVTGATLTLVAEGTTVLTGIKIENGIVKWEKFLKAGTYKFHVNSSSSQGEADSDTITLTIASVEITLSNTKTKYQYSGNLGGQDNYQWTASLGGKPVETQMSLIPSGSTSVIPKGLSIQNGYITWTSDLAYGTYYFKVKALYQGVCEGISQELEFKLTQATDQSYFTWTKKDAEKKTISLLSSQTTSADVVIPSYYKDDDNSIYKVSSLENNAFAKNTKLQSVIVPDAITSFGSYSFRGCENLKNITLPYHLDSCGWSTLESCVSITTVTIPEGWTILYSMFFSLCEELTTINLPNTILVFENSPFRCCTKLSNFVFPPLVDTISEYCFHDCQGLTSITIPKTIKTLQNCAFSDCFNLKDMYYEGTKAEFLALTRIERWHYRTGRDVSGGTIIHFTDGDYKLDEIDPTPEI